ncbi:MAG: MFS transporter [Helicobacteraceae bacterium]|nr:MFS transporter [Candidatus Sulfurimonas ponti]
MFAIIGVINYLGVVFLNAFTDLGHKIIIQNTIFKVYDGETQIILTSVVNALILLPFILMFSPSGFLADKYAKNIIMKHASLLAVAITLLITLSYYNGWFYIAFGLTFVLALQSAIYAPAKYGYIKELVGAKYICSGNGAVQAVTTVAILGGIIFYSVLFENYVHDNFATKEEILQVVAPLGWLLVFGSVVEWFLSTTLPNRMTHNTKKKFDYKRYIRGEYLFKNLKIVKRKPEVFEAIIVLSLFWSISQVILSIFGEYAKSELGITNAITVQGVMALAGFGIVAGSILAAKFSKYYINMGLVSIGSVGIMMVVFLVAQSDSIEALAFLFTIFGVFAGLVMVPLNARIQLVTPSIHLGTVLAGSNFIQNIFMVGFLIVTTVFAYFGTNAESLFYFMGFVALYMTVTVFKRYLVMTFWTTLELLSMIGHKYEYIGLENIPLSKGVLLLGNHVSWLDWIILQLPLNKQINFMMDREIYNWRLFNFVCRKGEAIPISSKASKDAFKEAHSRLLKGKIVALYPEGKISETHELGKFMKGYELIDKDYDGVIVPFFISGLEGSLFSRCRAKSPKSFFKRRVITVYFGRPISKETKAEELQKIIQEMKDKHEK